jgi:hypothetical protein
MSSVFLSKMNPAIIMSPDTDREIERVDREAELIRQRDRTPLTENREPVEVSPSESRDPSAMLEGLMEVLLRRQQKEIL